MTYFEAPDGHGESCIWVRTDNYPWCLLRESDVAGTDAWPDVVARMTGTSITTDDATVKRVAQALWAETVDHPWDEGIEEDHNEARQVARAVLTAIKGGRI
jgi:hypothetical protein